jgi:hypothetical protein
MRSFTVTARLSAACGLALALSASMAAGVQAFDEDKGEKEQLEACERSLCDILVKRGAGSDLQCTLQKTWSGGKIKEGVEQKKLKWGFGDLRCNAKLDAKRQEMVDALSKPEYELKLPAHAIKCEIERGSEVIPVSVSLAPKLQFKDGKVAKAWLGIGVIEAPAVVKGAIWTAAQLEDTFGIVHSELVKEINTFVHERCPKRVAK